MCLSGILQWELNKQSIYYLFDVYEKSFINIGNIKSNVSTNVVRGVMLGKTSGSNSCTSPDVVEGPMGFGMRNNFAATLSPVLYSAQKLGAQ